MGNGPSAQQEIRKTGEIQKLKTHVQTRSTTYATNPFYNFIWTIENFSNISNSTCPYTSGEFRALNYQWKLQIYPKRTVAGVDYLAVYLFLHQVGTQSNRCQYHVKYQLSILNQAGGKEHSSKEANYDLLPGCSVGYGQFISLKDLHNVEKGYLINDKCVFGVNILEASQIRTICETLAVHEPQTHTLVIPNFSTLPEDQTLSQPFTLCGRQWQLAIYPGGFDKQCKALSLYLRLVAPITSSIRAKYSFSIIDQMKGQDWKSDECSDEFTPDKNSGVGVHKSIQLEDFHNHSRGFIVSDTCMFRVNITIL